MASSCCDANVRRLSKAERARASQPPERVYELTPQATTDTSALTKGRWPPLSDPIDGLSRESEQGMR